MQVIGSLTYTKKKQIGIGQGMNSEVYLADEPQLGGTVAVKEISKAKLGNNVAAYFAEAQAMFNASHDNIVAVQYACETPTGISLVMRYLKKGSLADRIADRPLPLGEVLRVAQGVLAGLARIHIAGYVHFDVKPSNVLFSDQDAPMVSDFGQARSISATGVVRAPPMYCFAWPPEVMATGVGSPASDVYQAGLLMYRAANGDGLYREQEASVATHNQLVGLIKSGRFPDRRRFMPHVPRRLRTLIRRALMTDPAARFQTATEMADALARVPLRLDWTTEPIGGGAGGFRWRARRLGCADLVVELDTDPEGGWRVATYTETIGAGWTSRRARAKGTNWRRHLSLPAAHSHLKQVFERFLE